MNIKSLNVLNFFSIIIKIENDWEIYAIDICTWTESVPSKGTLWLIRVFSLFKKIAILFSQNKF